MEPSNSILLSFKLLSRTFSNMDIENYNQYITNLAHTTFVTLQSDVELMSNYSVHLLLIHYLIEQIEHLQKSLDSLTTLAFENPLTFIEKQYNLKNCCCIYCKFPYLCTAPLDIRMSFLFTYIEHVETRTRLFILTVIEKLLEIQNIHTLTMQYLYPQMSSENVRRYVTINE